jgi:hypothetical protein
VQNTIEEKIPVIDIIELTSDGNYLLVAIPIQIFQEYLKIQEEVVTIAF